MQLKTARLAPNQLLAAFLFGSAIVFALLGQYLIGPPNIHSARALVMLVEAAVVVIWLVSNPEVYLLKRSVLLRWLGGLWLAVGFLGVFFASFNWATAFIGQMEWFLHLLVLLALADAFNKGKVRVEAFFFGLIGAALVLIGFFIHRWVGMVSPKLHNWFWDAQPFLHIRHFAFLMLPAYVSSLFFLLNGVRRFFPLCFVVSAVLLASLFWAGGRASIGAALIATLLLTYWALKRERFGLLVLSVVISCLGVGAFFLSELFAVDHSGMGLSLNHGREGSNTVDALSSGRLSIWLSVVSDMKPMQWLVGHGVDNYRYLPGRWDETVHPHSWLFQSISAWGAPIAILLFAGGFCLAGVLGWKAYRKEGCQDRAVTTHGGTQFAVAVILFSYLLLSAVDGNLYHSWGVLLILPFFSAAMRYLWNNSAERENAKKEKRVSGGWLYSTAVALTVVAIQLVNVTTVFSRNSPEPDDWRTSVVLAVPYNTLTLESWLSDWQQKDPGEMLKLLRWLQENSPAGYRFMLIEAEMLAEAGFEDEANQKYQEALARAPNRAKVKIEEAGPPVGG